MHKIVVKKTTYLYFTEEYEFKIKKKIKLIYFGYQYHEALKLP